MISFEKKALIVVNANVTVAYDLHKMKYDIDEKNKTITIEELKKKLDKYKMLKQGMMQELLTGRIRLH